MRLIRGLVLHGQQILRGGRVPELAGLTNEHDAQRATPRSRPVRTATASGAAYDKLLPRLVIAVDAFRSSGMVSVVHSAGGLVPWLDRQSVVIGQWSATRPGIFFSRMGTNTSSVVPG